MVIMVVYAHISTSGIRGDLFCTTHVGSWSVIRMERFELGVSPNLLLGGRCFCWDGAPWSRERKVRLKHAWNWAVLYIGADCGVY